MIPIWTEDTTFVRELKKCHCYALEHCIFCNDKTNTWHENTNNPVCKSCADKHVVSDIKKSQDHGVKIRADKRKGIFDRGDSVRAN